MRYIKRIRIVVAFLSIAVLSLIGNPFEVQAYEDTQCFKCHTSARDLIKITREIAKTKDKAQSEMTKGEG